MDFDEKTQSSICGAKDGTNNSVVNWLEQCPAAAPRPGAPEHNAEDYVIANNP